MLGGERQIGSPKPSAKTLGLARAMARASLLLATRITGLPLRAERVGDDFVARGHAFARVDHEQADIGVRDRRLVCARHARGETSGAAFIEARGVDQQQIEPAEMCSAPSRGRA